MKAVLKRYQHAPGAEIVSGDLTVDPARRSVKVNGKELELTTLEYELIHLFVRNPGRKFTRDELLSRLRGEEIEAFGRAIDNLVSRVRQKLKKLTDTDCIRTVWGTGYMYVEAGKAK
jgi:DNA-binding response OmpR family regulator